MKQQRRGDPKPPAETLLPISPEDFGEASRKALKAALSLAAWVSNVTVDSMEEAYRQWCQSGRFSTEEAVLGDEDMDDDEAIGWAAEAPQNEGPASVLEQFHSEATAEKDMGLQEEGFHMPKPVVLDLNRVPDRDLMEVIISARETDFDFEKDSLEPDARAGIPTNLFQSLRQLGDHASTEEKLDSCWRLLMFLRHWRGGADRTWISNPRLCRKRAKALNWHQRLVFEGRWLASRFYTFQLVGFHKQEPSRVGISKEKGFHFTVSVSGQGWFLRVFP